MMSSATLVIIIFVSSNWNKCLYETNYHSRQVANPFDPVSQYFSLACHTVRGAAITEEHRCNANQGRSISGIKDPAATTQSRSGRVIRPEASDAVATADRDPTSNLELGGMRDASKHRPCERGED